MQSVRRLFEFRDSKCTHCILHKVLLKLNSSARESNAYPRSHSNLQGLGKCLNSALLGTYRSSITPHGLGAAAGGTGFCYLRRVPAIMLTDSSSCIPRIERFALRLIDMQRVTRPFEQHRPSLCCWWHDSPRLGEGRLACFISRSAGEQQILFLIIADKNTKDGGKEPRENSAALVSEGHRPSVTVKMAPSGCLQITNCF